MPLCFLGSLFESSVQETGAKGASAMNVVLLPEPAHMEVTADAAPFNTTGAVTIAVSSLPKKESWWPRARCSALCAVLA